jgi:predicted lipoprotein with Yx(FWY)xxD motif
LNAAPEGVVSPVDNHRDAGRYGLTRARRQQVKRSYLAIGALALIAALLIAGCGGSSSSTTETTTEANETAANETKAANETEAPAEEGGRYGNEAGAKPAGEPEPAGEATPVSVGEASGVGKVLVNSEGMTLYYFEKDQKGSGKSKCEGSCAEAWPPLTTEGEPEAMSGVKTAMLGTIEREDGSTQVTYAGWPLYTYVADTKPGEDNGTDSKAFGASWYPLHPNGQKAGH